MKIRICSHKAGVDFSLEVGYVIHDKNDGTLDLGAADAEGRMYNVTVEGADLKGRTLAQLLAMPDAEAWAEEEASESVLLCAECGFRCEFAVGGVVHHLREDGTIDHDADADCRQSQPRLGA